MSSRDELVAQTCPDFRRCDFDLIGPSSTIDCWFQICLVFHSSWDVKETLWKSSGHFSFFLWLKPPTDVDIDGFKRILVHDHFLSVLVDDSLKIDQGYIHPTLWPWGSEAKKRASPRCQSRVCSNSDEPRPGWWLEHQARNGKNEYLVPLTAIWLCNVVHSSICSWTTTFPFMWNSL
jgi:hypothetical protein